MTSYIRIVLLLAISQLACQHHVVFEEIGEMAGALSYIHAVVPVNISGLSQAVENFKTDVALWRPSTERQDSTPVLALMISSTSAYSIYLPWPPPTLTP
jgi:hypothetical protein